MFSKSASYWPMMPPLIGRCVSCVSDAFNGFVFVWMCVYRKCLFQWFSLCVYTIFPSITRFFLLAIYVACTCLVFNAKERRRWDMVRGGVDIPPCVVVTHFVICVRTLWLGIRRAQERKRTYKHANKKYVTRILMGPSNAARESCFNT